ncbi:MAG TPA: radical SAM protein [Thermoplasmata archaeon]|jgi:radical SAM superfamily enzyme with C-terminal helix-hairpin-helix motif
MKALVFDGYTDEPACLGVPPYVSPHARLAYGALADAGAEASYVTVDQWRAGNVRLEGYDLLAVIRNIAVPGKYLRGMPASDKELVRLADSFKGKRIASLGIHPKNAPAALVERYDHVAAADLDATLFDFVDKKEIGDRRRTETEWNAWLLRGAEMCRFHPDHGGPLIAEVQMYRGCVRYLSGGCRFCIEPLFGDVLYRKPRDILEEVLVLARMGVRNFRLGAQSCVYCYMSEETGVSETPKPNPGMVTSLLRSIRERVEPDVFHLDNANPAVIAEHPREAREITGAIAEYCTSGNVLAFGLESADPAVAKANNLNATAEQAMAAIRLVNELGRERGPTGLPKVLPGINFVCGLDGESKETYRLNFEFLKMVLDEGLMLRRINIRQVIPSRGEFPGVISRRHFEEFKRRVRNEIDGPLLGMLVPDGTVLRAAFTELHQGGVTYARQVGTYPLLISIPYRTELERFVDVAVTGRGFRSIEGIVHPTDVNTASLSMLMAVPGIGRKRAMAIIRRRPFKTADDLWPIFDETRALESAQFHLTCGNVVKGQ